MDALQEPSPLAGGGFLFFGVGAEPGLSLVMKGFPDHSSRGMGATWVGGEIGVGDACPRWAPGPFREFGQPPLRRV